MKIDIRDTQAKIFQIDFSSEAAFGESSKAFTICKGNNTKEIDLCDSNKYVVISGDDVENLIKALQKAVELGWTK